MSTNATPADATPGAIADAALALHRADPYGHPELKQVRQAITSASVTYDPDNALQLHEVLDRSIHGAVSAQATAHKADPEAHPELKQLRRAVMDANIAYDPLDPTQLSQAISRAVEGVTVENASETVKGIVRLATPTEAVAGTQTDLAVHPAGLRAAVAALVNGAPGALDTLKELADALGNDANFAATMTNLLATKAPLDSPALTGTPTAPTAAAGDASQQIATTEFVLSSLGHHATPVGSILLHSGPTAPPGYLIAAGQAVPRAAYPDLDAALYAGDTSNAFAPAWYRCTNSGNPEGSRSVEGDYIVLPDYRGEFLRGCDLGRGVDSDRVLGSWQTGSVQPFDLGNNTSLQAPKIGSLNDPDLARTGLGLDHSQNSFYHPQAGFHSVAATGSSLLANTADFGWGTTRPRNVAILICIKAYSSVVPTGFLDIGALQTQINTLSQTVGSLTPLNKQHGSTGFQYLPGGLLMQWGTQTGTLGNTVQLTFPIPFPTSCVSFVSTASSATSSPDSLEIASLTRTHATVLMSGSNSSIGYWLAIGY